MCHFFCRENYRLSVCSIWQWLLFCGLQFATQTEDLNWRLHLIDVNSDSRVYVCSKRRKSSENCGGKPTVLSSKLFDNPKFRPNEPKFRVSFYKIHMLPCQASCFQKSRPIVPQSFYIDMESLLQKSPQQSSHIKNVQIAIFIAHIIYHRNLPWHIIIDNTFRPKKPFMYDYDTLCCFPSTQFISMITRSWHPSIHPKHLRHWSKIYFNNKTTPTCFHWQRGIFDKLCPRTWEKFCGWMLTLLRST